MACDPLTFNALSSDQFGVLAVKAKAQDLDLSGTSGIVHYMGVAVEWSYDCVREQLTLQCVKKPFIYGCGEINKRLEELIRGSL